MLARATVAVAAAFAALLLLLARSAWLSAVLGRREFKEGKGAAFILEVSRRTIVVRQVHAC